MSQTRVAADTVQYVQPEAYGPTKESLVICSVEATPDK